MPACDFFVVETVRLKTVYILFFIELGSRRVYVADCTQHPSSAWVAQQARQICWNLTDLDQPMRFLFRDNGKKYSGRFHAIFQSAGLEVIRTPFQAANANAYAERFVRTVREECLDKLLILSERHLQRVLMEYLAYYNTRRPHQGLAQ